MNPLKAIHDFRFPELSKAEIPRPPRYVYLIGAFDGAKLIAVKIGSTRFLEERLENLQTGSIYKLKLMAFREGTKAEEVELHSLHRKDLIKGEWFNPTEAILRAFKLL